MSAGLGAQGALAEGPDRRAQAGVGAFPCGEGDMVCHAKCRGGGTCSLSPPPCFNSPLFPRLSGSTCTSGCRTARARLAR